MGKIISKAIGNIIEILYIVLCLFILVVNITGTVNGENVYANSFALPNVVLVLAGVVVGIIVLKLLSGRLNRGSFNKNILIMSGILLVLQIFIVNMIFAYCEFDPGIIRRGALDYIQIRGDHEFYRVYFEQNANNIPLAFVTKKFIELGNVIGVDGYKILVYVGVILTNITISIMTKTIYIYTDSKKMAEVGFIFGACLLGLSPWVMVPYSDVLSVCIPVLELYIYVHFNRTWYRYILLAVISLLGFMIKPTNLIVLIAVIIIEIYSALAGKYSRKDAAWCILSIILSLVIVVSLKGYIYNALNYEVNEASNKPMTHYLMMGLNEEQVGTYNWEDDQYTSSFQTKADKIDGNVDVIRQRLSQMGPMGFVKFEINKMRLDFGDGTFGWGCWSLDEPQNNSALAKVVQNVFYKNGRFYRIYSTLAHFVWMIVLCGQLLYMVGGREDKSNKEVLLKLIIVGFTLYLMLFEGGSRYVFHYVPVFIVAALSGIARIEKG